MGVSVEAKTFMKYFFFIFVFIVSYILINTKTIEVFGLVLFFITNILFFVFIGKDLVNGSISYDGENTERSMRYGVLLISMVFSIVSSVMMLMTIVTLQGKFSEVKTEIKWSPTDREHLDTTEILFITATTFIGVVALYVYNTEEDVRKFTYTIFDNVLNGTAANWLRVIFPIVIISLGSALYSRLQMPPLEVNKFPNHVVCDPNNDNNMQGFKDSFIKSFWFLFAFLMVILMRPFIEANFNYGGIYPSGIVGYSPGDRSFVFGRNPGISILSLLTLGISNLIGLNKSMGKSLNEDKTDSFANMLRGILLMPIFRWDVLYLLAKYAFGLTALVYAGFSLRDFQNIPTDEPCFFRIAHIRQLYIAFIVFLIIFYAFNILSASNITSIITNVMRFLVPPTLLGMTSYLVFITNYFMNMAPKLVIQ